MFQVAIEPGVLILFFLDLDGRFDPDQVLRLIEREKVTTWGGIPTMLHRVVHSPNLGRYDLSRLTRVTVGGAPTTPETMAQAARVLPASTSATASRRPTAS